MSALRQPDLPVEYYSPKIREVEITSLPQDKIEKSRKIPAQVVKPKTFYRANTLPNKLKVLSLIQKGSFGLAIASITTSLGVYISTVQIPKLWSQEYQHLEDLQRQERQLIAINETIKYQIAREAGDDSQLSVSKPESAVFISPAKVEAKSDRSIGKNKQAIADLKHSSYGY